MNFLILVLNIYINGELPFPYLVDKNQKIVLQDNKPFSPAECFDYAVVRTKIHAEVDFILSKCPKDFYLFATSKQAESKYSLSQFLKVSKQMQAIKKAKNLVVAFHAEKLQGAFILGQKKAKRLRYSHSFAKEERFAKLLFVHNNNWFLYFQTKTESKLVLINSFYMPRNAEWAKYWFSRLRNYWYKPSENVFLASFGGHKRQFAIYDMQSENWLLTPARALNEEEIDLIKVKKANLLVKLTQHSASEERHYYEIFIDGKKQKQTRYHDAGEEVIEAFQLANKTHRIQCVLYIAKPGSEKYKKEKNIKQLSAISIDIDSNKIYLVVLRKGKAHDNKPHKLQVLVFDKSLFATGS